MDVIRYPAPTVEHLHALHELLTRRGWVADESGHIEPGDPADPEAGWRYPASFGGAVMNYFPDVTPLPLNCRFRMGWESRPVEFVIESAGSPAGCEVHNPAERSFPLGEGDELRLADIVAILTELEPQAASLDPRALLECRFFGTCVG